MIYIKFDENNFFGYKMGWGGARASSESCGSSDCHLLLLEEIVR